jgi:D-glycero-alpha-D-manno-heptose-7-phosphate kinase
MIISKTPLRISLVGGSTDNPSFIEKYNYGSVISFPCNLSTYIIIHEDKIGYNSYSKKYILNYSSREEVDKISDIKNDIARVAFQHFDVAPINCTFTTDVFSQGSGLASSSSYMISLIKAICIKNNINLSDYEICDLAYKLEKTFNIHSGMQDPFGCGIGGFKRLEFFKEKNTKITYLPISFFDSLEMYLMFTGVTRNSKNVLQDVTKNIEVSKDLLNIVEETEKSILSYDYKSFFKTFKDGWKIKKATSSLILENIKNIDEELENNKNILAHKLCGAGNGGFFLIFAKPKSLINDKKFIPISVSSCGVTGKII